MPSATALLTRPELQFKSFSTLAAKAIPDQPGVVEAFVAVTGNTDDGGDIILPGAFLFKRNPKIVWSHDLQVLVGKVLAHEEYLAGDPRLPADLIAKGLGALWMRVQFDLEDPESHKAWRKVVFHEDLGWSIGYETPRDGFKVLPDGRRALTKIYVWEASPTTFGMNEEARTVAVKSLIQTTVDDLGLSEEKAKALTSLVEVLTTPETKSYPALEGSYEQVSEDLRTSLNAYAVQVYGERGEDNDWWVSIEGTFDDRVVASFRFYGGENENVTLQFPYDVDDEGGITLGEPTEVEVAAIVTPATGTTDAEDADALVTAALVAAKSALDGLEVKDGEPEDLETKKGRVLSEANANALRNAAEAISKVLAAASSEPEKEKEAKPKATVKPKEKADPAKAKAVEDDLETKGLEVVDSGDLAEMLASIA